MVYVIIYYQQERGSIMNNKEQEIYNYLLTIETFTKKEYENLCNEYGKTRVSEFINNFSIVAEKSLTQQEIDRFLNKYSLLFEEETNINNQEFRRLNSKLPETVTQYLRSMEGIKLFTVEEERAIFSRLNIVLKELSIININEKTLVVNIDYPSIFMSIKNEKQIKELIKLFKASYFPKGTNYYEKVLNSKQDRDIIEKYLKLYSKSNQALSKKELTINFKELEFNEYRMLDENEYEKQINYLIEFLTLFREIQYSNLRLVVSIAKKYVQKKDDFTDYIQEGNINGLNKAILKFDINKGYKFSTYASYWIMQSITRYSQSQGTIRKPVHMAEKIRKYKQTYAKLLMELGREPEKKELIEATGFTENECLTIEKAIIEPTSLDSPVGEEDKSSLLDFVSIDDLVDDETVEEKFEQKILREAIEKVLETLKPKEAEVIRLRFGLNDNGKTLTLGDIGEIYGITRERVRQIEAKALKRLRQPNIAKYIKDFY